MEETKIREKGANLLELKDDYTVIDIETTGLDPKWCEIIELAAVRVKNNEVVDTYQTFVQPAEEIGEFVSALTGITNEMVADAPKIGEALPEFLAFVGDSVILGHNVGFDINFIYDAKQRIDGKPLKNDYIDTMRLARRALPALPHHRLRDLVQYFDIHVDKQHRAVDDCLATLACYLEIKKIIVDNKIPLVTAHKPKLQAKDITAAEGHADPDSPLHGKVCVFTGKLDRMPRSEAMQIVANIGGINADNVTKKTNFLILGNNDYCTTIKGGKSSKQKKAEALILDGQDLQILSENVFYDMIENA